MSNIKKQILVSGNPHYVEINSSLELEEVEVTGSDPITGKVVHISMSSMLKATPEPAQAHSWQITPDPPYSSPQSQASPAPMDMFSDMPMPEPSAAPEQSVSQQQSITPAFSAQGQGLPMFSQQTPLENQALSMDMAIAIRTMVVSKGIAHVQAGAEIVYDSIPSREYEESLNKARALLKALEQAESENS